MFAATDGQPMAIAARLGTEAASAAQICSNRSREFWPRCVSGRKRAAADPRSCCRLPMHSGIKSVRSCSRCRRFRDGRYSENCRGHLAALYPFRDLRADPFVAGAVRSAKGQDLIERGAQREPSLVTIAFHIALPGRDNQIVASNFGRIGKPADADDRRVIATSTVLQEVTNEGKRFAVELPLRDHSGRTIGALSTSFMGTPGGQQAAYKSAQRVQQDLARSIRTSRAWPDSGKSNRSNE